MCRKLPFHPWTSPQSRREAARHQHPPRYPSQYSPPPGRPTQCILRCHLAPRQAKKPQVHQRQKQCRALHPSAFPGSSLLKHLIPRTLLIQMNMPSLAHSQMNRGLLTPTSSQKQMCPVASLAHSQVNRDLLTLTNSQKQTCSAASLRQPGLQPTHFPSPLPAAPWTVAFLRHVQPASWAST